MVVNTALTWLPKAIRTEMATTEMKARIKAYSTRVWPFLLFIRRSALLARIITLLIIVCSPPFNKKMDGNGSSAPTGCFKVIVLRRILLRKNLLGGTYKKDSGP